MSNSFKNKAERIIWALTLTFLAAALLALWVTIIFLQDVQADEILSLRIGKIVFVVAVYIILRQWLITQATVNKILAALERVLTAPAKFLRQKRWERSLRKNIAEVRRSVPQPYCETRF